MKRIVLSLLLAAVAAGAAPTRGHTQSMPTNRELSKDPIDIRSDRLEAHNKERRIVFLGNVQARQRDVIIFADRLTTFYDKEGKDVERIVAEGNVRITQADKVATAREALFENRSRVIVLTGEPHLWQGRDELRGEVIKVYLDEDRVLVDRARGVFTPQGMRVQTGNE